MVALRAHAGIPFGEALDEMTPGQVFAVSRRLAERAKEPERAPSGGKRGTSAAAGERVLSMEEFFGAM